MQDDSFYIEGRLGPGKSYARSLKGEDMANETYVLVGQFCDGDFYEAAVIAYCGSEDAAWEEWQKYQIEEQESYSETAIDYDLGSSDWRAAHGNWAESADVYTIEEWNRVSALEYS